MVAFGTDERRSARSPHAPARAVSAARAHEQLSAVATAATVICRLWKPRVLWLLASGCRRYTQLAARLPGISPKVLTQHLRELERTGLVTRHVVPRGERRVEYSLTPLGEGLKPILRELERWGREYRRAIERVSPDGDG